MSGPSEMPELDAWLLDLCVAAGIDPARVDRDAVLALAGRAAHAVVRPAAPVTTYVAGLLVGAAVADGQDAAESFERVVRLIDALLERD